MAQTESKPWYKSKIILAGLFAVALFGTQLLNNWITGQGVTPEQIAAIQEAQPEIANAIERVKAGESVLAVVGSLFGVAVMVLRAFFTNTAIK